jgi:hypothetical protein
MNRQANVNPWTFYVLLFLLGLVCISQSLADIPLPEHPRPDFQRPSWQNLNGPWQFRFDKENRGLEQQWFKSTIGFEGVIQVPFSWGSKLSGQQDQADIGWYHRQIQLPSGWQQRTFLVIGACDWHTTAWIDGVKLGEHQGGYTPFEFDLTDMLVAGKTHDLVLRVDDTPHPFKLEGKQGYGRAAGIWQTVYLESRPDMAIDTVHFTPRIDMEKVLVDVTLNMPAPQGMLFELHFNVDGEKTVVQQQINKNGVHFLFDVNIENPRLWSLDDPYLYEVDAVLKGDHAEDRVSTYFGMREISVGPLPGTEFPYVMLNGKPVYLQLALDQAYHPDGYYTFPSDEFMRDEILRTRSIGLNGQRIHIKVEIPRKLYWADKLGVLIQADVPNSWGQPEKPMQAESEAALRGMIKRDFNHPAIFSWVNFNETWGLFTRQEGRERQYTPATQAWVQRMYALTKQLDPTRLAEDNSPCNNDHVATDLNTWHAYLPGYAWTERLDQICRDTYNGSTWNYIGGNTQGNQTMFNSECGNVWGYEGSAGDCDWSWDYHLMINAFRRHPKCSGWLYTEHHDVINEWNGYWRYDRSKKYTGLPELVEGMRLNDFHNPFYIAMDETLCRTVQPGQTVEVPLFASFMTDQAVGDSLSLEAKLYGWDTLANKEDYWQHTVTVPYQPWMNKALAPLRVPMPPKPALTLLAIELKDPSGACLHRNFTCYLVDASPLPALESVVDSGHKKHIIRFKPTSFAKASWSQKQWQVMDGLKVNGAGSGFFEYRIPWIEDLDVEDIAHATIRLECSAKQLFGKDRDKESAQDGDFMRGKGTHDPSSNPNAYPMTDTVTFPSQLRVRVGDDSLGLYHLPDDSADHRGILSWHSQKKDRRLIEAGSYGYLVNAPIPAKALAQAAQRGVLQIRLEVDESLPGGLAIYGQRFGRYPMDPTIVISMK